MDTSVNKPPITLIEGFVPESWDAFNRLKNDLDWKRIGNTPRSEYYTNEHGVPYTYGKGDYARTYESQPTHILIDAIGLACGLHATAPRTNLDVCFLNMYLSQKDQLGWHADDSPEMDDARPICIVSLGVEREIWFKPIGGNNTTDVTRVLLPDRSVCIMAPGMQESWLHRIPKAAFNQVGERISLTYRGFVL